MDDEAQPAKKPSHQVGEDLALLSVSELEARIALLEGEIVRLRAAIDAKQSSRRVAEDVFKR